MGKVTRRNGEVIRWLRATAFALLTGFALNSLSFQPASAGIALSGLTGVVSLFAPGIAVLLCVVLMSLPLLATNLLVGAAFLILGFASLQFLANNDGRAFLIIGLGFVGASFGPAWAAVAIAGYLLGASEGAVVALLACMALEGAGLVLGLPSAGAILTGGTSPGLISTADVPSNLFSFGWLDQSLGNLDPSGLLSAFVDAESKLALALQPVVWAAGAAVTGLLRKPAEHPRRALHALGAAAAGVAATALGSFIVVAFVPGTEATVDIWLPAVASLLLALAFVAVWEFVFPPLPRKKTGAVRPGTMSAEDADVDELLRLISTAEDQLTSKHTTTSVVMITDMKSFSSMTEEDGSMMSAKTIQRHRDLLLPIITGHNGKGKSTGGDGLIASFESASDAVSAATEMQRALREYNSTHPSERDIIIRCGIASGEVVLDKGGRPFIGAALNLAARIMNLGDGGQVLSSRQIADARDATGVPIFSHGLFVLKNIAEPTEVVEILWAEGQQPLEPKGKRADEDE